MLPSTTAEKCFAYYWLNQHHGKNASLLLSFAIITPQAPFDSREPALPIHRHHIHLICDAKDSSLYELQDALAIFFEQKAFLTKDLFAATSEAANYSWRCITHCDGVFLLLGKSYGQLTNTGVSQLHISYLNAKTKNKPVTVFVVDATDRPRQLSDFLGMLQKQIADLHEINASTNLPTLFNQAYQQAINASTKTYAALPTPPTKAATNPPSKPIKPSKLLNLQDIVPMNCTAHAFQGGAIIEVEFLAQATWRTVLSSLVQHGLSFGLQGLWRMLNELATPQAMPAVKVSHPNVHAISRCQVSKADILWIEGELIAAGLITVHPQNSATKTTWTTTELAKNALKPNAPALSSQPYKESHDDSYRPN